MSKKMKTAIKICGLRDVELAKWTVSWGAHYIGILCYEQSKRYVDPQLGQEIAEAVISMGGSPVAVFVDSTAQQIISLCNRMGIRFVQLAGSTARRAQELLPSNFQQIYVLPVDDHGIVIPPEADRALSRLDPTRDYIMYDNLEGGSGQRLNLTHFRHPYSFPFFLAGGLRPENVTEVIHAVHPDVVDVSSGVESAPGIKDFNKIRAFIESVKRADQ